MKDLTKIYIDLSKCTEEQRKHIFSLLPKPTYSYQYIIDEDDDYILHFIGNGWWVVNLMFIRKQELTYPEFIKLFEVGDGEESIEHICKYSEYLTTQPDSERYPSPKNQVDIYSGELNTERILTYKKLSEQYNIEESTVRDIFNAGADWVINLNSK